jgi:hypothetical protein
MKRPESVKCSKLLLYTQAQSSTDQKDKIFAFQGLLNLLGVPFPAPDYAKPVRQVYREAAAVSIYHDHSLRLLSALTGESDVKGLPSWVPDWSNEHAISEIAMWDEEHATGNSRAVFEISKDKKLLTLHGKIIDTIEESSLMYPYRQSLIKLPGQQVTYASRKQEVRILQQWFDTFGGDVQFFTELMRNAWAKTKDPSYLESSGLVNYWVKGIKSLSSDETADNDLPKHIHQLIKDEHLFDINHVKKNIPPFHAIVNKLFDRKRMFKTKIGNLGVGCRSLEVGDRIALFCVSLARSVCDTNTDNISLM